jgi:hypothetical protein
VRALIADKFQVSYSKSGLRKLFARLGWSYQRGRKLYHRRTAEDQARYEQETCTTLADLAARGVKVVPLASDQSKVYLEGTLGRRWNPIGEQPLIPQGRARNRPRIYMARCIWGPGLKSRRLPLIGKTATRRFAGISKFCALVRAARS